MPAMASAVRSATGTATREEVSRLYARVAFGATPADLDTWEGQAYEAVVDHLLDFPALDTRPPGADDADRLLFENADEVGVRVYGVTPGVSEAAAWWVERMRTTAYPLEERMTLFWHDHFATGYLYPWPDTRMMVVQNQTMRRYALGNLRDLVAVMTLDPAMLYWLNGNENAVGKPNENYARELFELFTLGVVPQVYTEDDIREAARALTGWVVDPDLKRVTFSAVRHDTRPKTIMGVTFDNLGNQEYLKVIDIALEQPVAPKFIAWKLVLNFAYVPGTGDLFQDPDPLVDKVADTLRSTSWDLKAAMRTLLLADEFRFADVSAGRQLVRQPVDLVASACKAIGVSARAQNTITLLGRMGQVPFDPPNVGGWPVNREWLSPVTTLARYDWGVTCYNLWSSSLPGVRPALPPSGDPAAWTARFGLAGLSDNTKNAIDTYLGARATASESEKQAGVLILLASSPDWMVI